MLITEKKVMGVVLVVIGTILVGAGGVFGWGWILVAGGLFLLLLKPQKDVVIPEFYREIPIRARWNGYFIYTVSMVRSQHEHAVIFEDGSRVSNYSSEGLRVQRGANLLCILDHEGKQVFPGVK